MKTYNITHAYLVGKSEVSIKSSVTQEVLENAIALICFTLEHETGEDSALADEHLIVKCLKVMYPEMVESVTSSDGDITLDQHWIREERCGSFYIECWDLWKSGLRYNKVVKVIKSNPKLINV